MEEDSQSIFETEILNEKIPTTNKDESYKILNVKKSIEGAN